MLKKKPIEYDTRIGCIIVTEQSGLWRRSSDYRAQWLPITDPACIVVYEDSADAAVEKLLKYYDKTYGELVLCYKDWHKCEEEKRLSSYDTHKI